MFKVLQLDKNVCYNKKLYRLEKGSTLRFTVSPDLATEDKIELFTNHPIENQTFKRNSYNQLIWKHDNNNTQDIYADLFINQCGAFQFYLDVSDSDEKSQVCCGSFLVDPDLVLHNGDKFSIDNIIIHTVLVKQLGPFHEWKKRLEVSHQTGYNMIHFTPIQELGESNSSYSIKHHQKLNPCFSTDAKEFNETNLQSLIYDMYQEWNMFSVVDVVWNHVANNCDWILQHPDAGFNLVNSPHLKPAFIVDRLLWHVNRELSLGHLENQGIPSSLKTEEHLNNLSNIIRKRLEKINLSKYFVLDVKQMNEKFTEFMKSHDLTRSVDEIDSSDVKIIQDESFEPFGCYVDFNLASKICLFKSQKFLDPPYEKNEIIEECRKHFNHLINMLNKEKYEYVMGIEDKIVGNTISHARYHFIDAHGPKYEKVTDLQSIAVRYFNFPFKDMGFDEECLLVNKSEGSMIMAHNGWVMGGDALKNFAEKDSSVYLCRELIAWGDSIKLRYGDKMEDSPFLWQFMKEYTQEMAKLFHGFRIDNCHSTPIHLAQYLLDCAREVNPNLYVMAELFTNSEDTDNTFINNLGINSMIRESLGSSSPYDFGRHVYRYGGESIGSFFRTTLDPLKPSMSHAVFMDMTHDNQTQCEARSIFNTLPTAMLVSASCCGSGSSKGFDLLVPHHINVVKETRLWKSWSEQASDLSTVAMNDGILSVKSSLNRLHKQLQNNGFYQIFVDQMSENVVAVTRLNPETNESYIFIGHCAFSSPSDFDIPQANKVYHHSFKPIKLAGVFKEVVLEAQLLQKDFCKPFVKDDKFINGSDSVFVVMQENICIEKSKLCVCKNIGDKEIEIHLNNFFPGSIVVFKTALKPVVQNAVNELRSFLPSQESGDDINLLEEIVSNLSLTDLNHVLYRCHNEEVDDGFGGGVYDIPGYGPLVYCGLQGILSVLHPVRVTNDLGHPICDNIRQGDWMAGYTANRLKQKPSTSKLGDWLENRFSYMSILPRYLVLPMFESILNTVYLKCLDQVYRKMSKFIQDGTSFTRSLALCSVQVIGHTKSAVLPPISKKVIDDHSLCSTMAAGLPHFASGFMRCWGRDTFISLKGLMLLTGRFAEARHMLLSFGGVVRHGLVPNLLASGINARYNARDATWFWLQAVQEYCKLVGSNDILSEPVLRMYPTEDSEPCVDNAIEQPLQDVIHEILQCHFEGIGFRERNAGHQLDMDMSEEGFNVSAGVDMTTGFVYGGGAKNCGTWMDKMGGSEKAKNKGCPATPRDGSAVEIVGMCKSSLRWLIQLNHAGVYKYDSVTKTINGESIIWTYKNWEEKIAENFEKLFYISEVADNKDHGNMIHKRCIYKDSYLSSSKFTDYQLRPNFPIAMCVAPDLFDTNHAIKALNQIQYHLLGPLGLATLDPDDWNYDGYYENHLDNENFKKSKGFNYHQGPEWTWVLGPFLSAILIFAKKSNDQDLVDSTKKFVLKVLSNHQKAIVTSPWKGLTELTNKNGAYCEHSCPTQAWSAGCLLEVLFELNQS